MTPEEAKQWIGEIVSRMAYRDNGYLNSTQNAYSRDIAEQSQTKSRQVAALIESLVAGRDALAEQVRVMREALEAAAVQVPEFLDYIGPRGHSDVQQKTNPTSNLVSSALALPPAAAEQRAKENAEKAAKWDEARRVALALDEKLSEALKTKVGFADKDFEIAVTLLSALIESAFGKKVPENGLICSAVLTDGSEIFVEARRRTGEPYVKQAEGWREKAALLDWATTRMETHNEYVFPVFGPTSQDPDCRFAWFRYDRNGLAYETAYDALRAAKEASDEME